MIVETVYDILDGAGLPVFVQGSKIEPDCIIVEYPSTTTFTTLDRIGLQTSVFQIRCHTLHRPGSVNSGPAKTLSRQVRDTLPATIVIDGENVFVPHPDVFPQQYEREGKSAFDVVLTYSLNTTVA